MLFEAGNYEDARIFLADKNDDNSKLLIYKSFMLEKNISQAEQYLLSLTNRSEQLNDFVAIQLINIKQINSNYNNEISSTELNTILDVATKSHPYAAYAKSMYFWITGELLSSEYPPVIYQENGVGERTTTGSIREENTVLAYPVPFNDYLYLEFKHDPSEKSTLIIENILGRRLIELDNIKQSQVFDTSNWAQGVYFVYIISNDNIIHFQKVSLVK